ncbi:MAG TPA: hypothetical protein DIC52_22950 [Candidatus Latescibacteria bacterium]|nr:hypothetical protein [Candidatus Latescibacterota bacterium]
MAAVGIELPPVYAYAAHLSRLDLLQKYIDRKPKAIGRLYAEHEVYPPELGIELPPVYAYVTSLTEVTLLHMAVEWGDLPLATWLLNQGADVNATAGVDEQGFGGWTPIYHGLVTLRVPRHQRDLIDLLLSRGADVDVTASIRKPLADEPPHDYVEYRDAPLEYARQFVYPDLINEAALEAVS